MKHNNPLAKQLNLRNFRRQLIAAAYKRAIRRAANKQAIAAMSTTTVGIETAESKVA